jgi:hypothetical protein
MKKPTNVFFTAILSAAEWCLSHSVFLIKTGEGNKLLDCPNHINSSLQHQNCSLKPNQIDLFILGLLLKKWHKLFHHAAYFNYYNFDEVDMLFCDCISISHVQVTC